MKYFIFTIIAIASALLIYNLTHIEFDNLKTDTSKTALITVFSSACTIILMLILLISQSIQKKRKK